MNRHDARPSLLDQFFESSVAEIAEDAQIRMSLVAGFVESPTHISSARHP